MRYSLLLLAVAATRTAQDAATVPNVKFINFPHSPLEFVPSSSAEFARILSDFAGPVPLLTIEKLAPFPVILKNTGNANIRAVTVVWTASDNLPMTFEFEVKPEGVPPGDMVLMAPLSGLSIHIRANTPAKQPEEGSYSRPSLQALPQLEQTIRQFLDRYGQSEEISITLDSVIFWDNTFAGPDGAGKFDEENRFRRLTRELVAGLLVRAPSERGAFLQQILDDPDAQNASATAEAGQRYRVAQMLMSVVAEPPNDEDLVRRSLSFLVSNDSQELRRRQP